MSEPSELLQVKSEIVMVPIGIERELVVRNHECALLLLRQVLDPNDGDALKAQQLRSLESPMPGDDLALTISENWHVEAKFANGGRDLANLLVRMGFRIATSWVEFVQQALFNLQHRRQMFLRPIVSGISSHVRALTVGGGHRQWISPSKLPGEASSGH